MHDATMFSVPVVVGVVAAIRQATDLPARFLPLLSLAAGMATGMLFGGVTTTALAEGVVIGLSASGLYSGAKAVVRG